MDSKYEALEKEFGAYLLQAKRLSYENEIFQKQKTEMEEQVKKLEAQLNAQQSEFESKVSELNTRLAKKQADELQVQHKLEQYFVKYKAAEREVRKLKFRAQAQAKSQLARQEAMVIHNETGNIKAKASLLSRFKRWVKLVTSSKRKQGEQLKLTTQQAEIIRTSPLFDQSYYMVQNKDVAEKGVDPAEHYLKFGAFEGRNPSPHFNSKWYLTTYPDVAQEGMNPLLHYIQYGAGEGRSIQPADRDV